MHESLKCRIHLSTGAPQGQELPEYDGLQPYNIDYVYSDLLIMLDWVMYVNIRLVLDLQQQ